MSEEQKDKKIKELKEKIAESAKKGYETIFAAEFLKEFLKDFADIDYNLPLDDLMEELLKSRITEKIMENMGWGKSPPLPIKKAFERCIEKAKDKIRDMIRPVNNTSQPAGKKICAACGQDIRGDQFYCDKCGVKQ